MEFFSKVRSGFSHKSSRNRDRKIKGYIQTCEYIHDLCVSMYPDIDPHEQLVIVLCTIWTKSGVFKEEEIDKPTQAREIVAYTLLPACLPTQNRARVLAYKLIMEDKALSSRLSTRHAECYREYSTVSKSVWGAKRNGLLRDLYCRYNKNKLHQMLLFPTRNNYKMKRDSTVTQNNKYLQCNIVSEVGRLIGQVSKIVSQQHITLCI